MVIIPSAITNTSIKIGTSSTPTAVMPTPSAMSVGYQDVDLDSGRSTDGTMKRNKVAMKRTLSITWPPMVPADVKKVLSAITGTGSSKSSFYVDYLDPLLNERHTIKVYTGDRTIPVYNYTIGVYDSFDVELVEF